MESLWESVFGKYSFNRDSMFDAVNIHCPCGAMMRIKEGVDSTSFAPAAEKFLEIHKECGKDGNGGKKP